MKYLNNDYAANTDLAPFKSNCHYFKPQGCARERPLMGSSCAECTTFKPRLTNDRGVDLSSLGISNILGFPHQTYNYGFISRMFCYAMFVITRKVDTNFADVSRRVLRSECVECAVKDAAREQFNNDLLEKDMDNSDLLELEAEQRSRAVQILSRMRTCISSVLLRIAGWVMFKLFSRMLTKIYVNNGQIEMVRQCRTTANIPIIYLPLHRSHVDYILMTFILYMNNIKPPLVAAGDNLLIGFFGNLLRGLGAFFIRRRLDDESGKKDHVYRAVLQSYIKENLREGQSLEFFIEGGRSRTGKALMPKSGLLSAVVDSILEGVIDDAFIVPVAISYEKILDGSFSGEQLGKPKRIESFSLAVKSIYSTLRSNYGAVRVDFCNPYSLKDYLENAAYNIHSRTESIKSVAIHASNKCAQRKCSACSGLRHSSSLSSLYGLDIVVSEDKRLTIEKLAEHVVYDAFNSTTLMSTQLVAFLLLTKHRRGVTLHDLAQSLDWLRNECYRRKRDIGFTGDSKNAVRHSIILMGKELLSIRKMSLNMSKSTLECDKTDNDVNMRIVYLIPAIKSPQVLDLQYYANSCISLFLLDSVVANSLILLISSPIDCLLSCDNLESNISIDFDELINKSLLLCDILQYDFIFAPPCQSLYDCICNVIEDMKLNGTLVDKSETDNNNHNLRQRYREYDFDDEDNDGYYGNQNSWGNWNKRELKVICSDQNVSQIKFYRSILAPYIECYWLVACALIKLIGVTDKIDKVFFAELLEMAKYKQQNGLLIYEESISMETFRNAVKLFESWKILQINSASDGSKQISLCAAYDSDKAVNDVILKIENYKN